MTDADTLFIAKMNQDQINAVFAYTEGLRTGWLIAMQKMKENEKEKKNQCND